MSKMNLEVVIDLDDVLEEVAGKYYPEEVFSKEALEKWALENDFIKEE